MAIALEVKHLTVNIASPQGEVHAVDDVSFSIHRGKTLALLGESGCGKSVTALSLLRLLPENAAIAAHSQVVLGGQDLLDLSEVQMRSIRGRRLGIIFQEPMTSLNPVLTIAQQLTEVLACHTYLPRREQREAALALLEDVGMPEPQHCLNDYPHQLSGGMKQRVMIAMALAAKPDVLIADEPTTALDVTIQAQILRLLRDLQQQKQVAMLLITHDLGVVKTMADEVAVMYAGHLVEQAPSGAFFTKPLHPYSQQLFASLPDLQKRGQALQAIKGIVPSLTQSFAACRFADRCPLVMPICHTQAPAWYRFGQGRVRCHLYADTTEVNVVPAPEKTQKNFPLADKPMMLKVEQMKVHFPIRRGILKRTVGYVKAVDGVSFALHQGETLAIVGESGCGKTTLGRALLGLLPITSGRIDYNPQHLSQKDVQIIFQDPFSAMNPRMLVTDILQEGMLAHGIGKSLAAREAIAKQLLLDVGLSAESLYRYPHEFSGGQRQRINIARALAVKPKVMVCDEPTSALDVSVQAQVLNLLQRLQQKYHLSYLLISHNLAVVAYLADRILVMSQGKMVEQGMSEKILQMPKHPYTQRLLEAVLTV